MNALQTLNNVPTMTSREIAELTGKRHDNVLTDIRTMLAIIQSPEISGDYKDSRGRTYQELILDKEQTLILVSGYSIEMRAKIVRRWMELEAAQVKPPVIDSAVRNMEAATIALESMRRVLNICDSSYLGLLQETARLNGLLIALPHYAIDAPPTVATQVGSSSPTKSLTALLRDYQVPLSAAAFNKLLAAEGTVEKRERISRSGKTKTWYAFTDAGLEYGKNLSSPRNPRETQCHFYVDTFEDLLDLLN